MQNTAILCVDDEVLILEALETELHRAFGDRYVYEFAESAEEALEIMAELEQSATELKVVITDWLMPQMRGDELLLEIQQKRPNTVKIVLTGQADQQAIEKACIHSHLDYCINKPWDSKALIHLLQTSLAHYGYK
ncbi:response regulator [Candidatus Albibeggiatoa sp. nov. NOAA]|uniref:response regulator n=1 Tax=Candidatus Albibeggiatoa sp. nov. NOAA TaxID=3162724 RepID=UPI0032FC2E62|nr:response regulator [Thiotrichaceae bacterium]